MLWAKRGRSYAPRSTYGRCEADSLNSKPEIIHAEQSQADLDTLVDAAENIINEKFVPDPRSIFTCRKGSGTVFVDLGAVMSHARMRRRVWRRKRKTLRRVCYRGLWSERRSWRHGRGTCGPWR